MRAHLERHLPAYFMLLLAGLAASVLAYAIAYAVERDEAQRACMARGHTPVSANRSIYCVDPERLSKP